MQHLVGMVHHERGGVLVHLLLLGEVRPLLLTELVRVLDVMVAPAKVTRRGRGGEAAKSGRTLHGVLQVLVVKLALLLHVMLLLLHGDVLVGHTGRH